MKTSGVKSVEQLEAEAAAWATKINAAPDQVHSGLDDWLTADPKHTGALLRAQATLALFEPTPSEDHAAQSQPVRRWKRLTAFGGAAALATAGFAGLLLINSQVPSYETDIGEVRSVSLSDGSSVSIDAKSRIDVDFTAKSRDIHLRAGKVLFRAAHNAQRPFRVIVDNVVINDIGTAFQVTADDPPGEVDVVVTEGSVRVDAPGGQITLIAGQRASFSKVASNLRPVPVRVAPADMERTLAWRDGLLQLNGETLNAAIAEFNRHSRVPLSVRSTELGRESLYGSFRMDDAAGFARTVAAGLDAEARTSPDGIVIEPKKK